MALKLGSAPTREIQSTIGLWHGRGVPQHLRTADGKSRSRSFLTLSRIPRGICRTRAHAEKRACLNRLNVVEICGLGSGWPCAANVERTRNQLPTAEKTAEAATSDRKRE